MTYQKPSPHYDTADADEASSLVLTVVDASPSFSLGPDGVATKKKNGVPTMRAMITMCFVLGTLVVLYGGRSGRNSNTARSTGGLSAALLRGARSTGGLSAAQTAAAFPNSGSLEGWCHLYCLAEGLGVRSCTSDPDAKTGNPHAKVQCHGEE